MTKILIVDDEHAILDSFQKFFDKEGYTVYTASNAAEALVILKSQKVDLAILDVLMPKISGLDLALKIKSNPATKNLKIIFVTVLDAPRSDEEELIPKILPKAWLQKPIDAGKLRKVVKQVMGNE